MSELDLPILLLAKCDFDHWEREFQLRSSPNYGRERGLALIFMFVYQIGTKPRLGVVNQNAQVVSCQEAWLSLVII